MQAIHFPSYSTFAAALPKIENITLGKVAKAALSILLGTASFYFLPWKIAAPLTFLSACIIREIDFFSLNNQNNKVIRIRFGGNPPRIETYETERNPQCATEIRQPTSNPNPNPNRIQSTEHETVGSRLPENPRRSADTQIFTRDRSQPGPERANLRSGHTTHLPIENTNEIAPRQQRALVRPSMIDRMQQTLIPVMEREEVGGGHAPSSSPIRQHRSSYSEQRTETTHSLQLQREPLTTQQTENIAVGRGHTPPSAPTQSFSRPEPRNREAHSSQLQSETSTTQPKENITVGHGHTPPSAPTQSFSRPEPRNREAHSLQLQSETPTTQQTENIAVGRGHTPPSAPTQSFSRPEPRNREAHSSQLPRETSTTQQTERVAVGRGHTPPSQPTDQPKEEREVVGSRKNRKSRRR